MRLYFTWRTVHSPFFTVKPPLTVTSLQRLLFLSVSPYTDSCQNLSTMATFFCPQDGRCGEVQLYFVMVSRMDLMLSKIRRHGVAAYPPPPVPL